VPDSLPLIRSSRQEAPPLTETASGPLPRIPDRPPAERGDSTRILIVEDSEDHCELLLRQLRKSNLDAHVKIIGDGQAAWDYLQQSCRRGELIAIFLDLHLPSMDGLQILRQIRRHPELSSVSVIVISSSDDPAVREECRALNVYAFASKPISFSTFSKTVADVFHSADTRSRNRPE
jgi:CheY-like chemotaxis protein